MAAAKKKKKKSTKKNTQRNLKILWPIGIGLLLIITLSVTFYAVFLHQERKADSSKTIPGYEADQPRTPLRGLVEPPVIQPAKSKEPQKKKAKALVAIVIDDMGYRQEIGDGLLDLDLELSFAFLPDGPHTAEQAEKALQMGRDVLLHFPMEPEDSQVNPGPGTAYLAMDRDNLQKIFFKNMAAVPMAKGINNHMGSKYTKNPKAMGMFLEYVKGSNLFFLDSMTAPDSMGYTVSRQKGVKTAKRSVFLDNTEQKLKINIQLEKLIALAEKNGQAIGIGHPKQETYEALKDLNKKLEGRAKLVGVSALVR